MFESCWDDAIESENSKQMREKSHCMQTQIKWEIGWWKDVVVLFDGFSSFSVKSEVRPSAKSGVGKGGLECGRFEERDV